MTTRLKHLAIFPRKADFSCFGYHPDLESRLTFQEKWLLGCARVVRQKTSTGSKLRLLDPSNNGFSNPVSGQMRSSSILPKLLTAPGEPGRWALTAGAQASVPRSDFGCRRNFPRHGNKLAERPDLAAAGSCWDSTAVPRAESQPLPQGGGCAGLPYCTHYGSGIGDLAAI